MPRSALSRSFEPGGARRWTSRLWLARRATLAFVSAIVVGCGGPGAQQHAPSAALSGRGGPVPAGSAPRPAPISHVVFVTFDPEMPADERARLGAQLVADADRSLATIPGVVAYAAGTHLDTGRPTVDAAYDVGLYIGFVDQLGYARYVEHPRHVEFVARWKPHLSSLVVRDFLDERSSVRRQQPP